jgi:hypothetical protein
MGKMTDDIIKFVEEGIFESGKAYAVIKAFEQYLKDAFSELLSNYNWTEFNLKPDLDNINFGSSPRKSMGDYFACHIPIKINNNSELKTMVLVFNSSTMGFIRIHGRWNGEKEIQYKDLNNVIKLRADNEGIKLDILLEEKDRLNFSFNEYFTMILDALSKHALQLK